MFAMRPMKLTARGPGNKSLISQSAYSVVGCQASAGFGFNASLTSSSVKPSPTGVSELGGDEDSALVGDGFGVGGKKA